MSAYPPMYFGTSKSEASQGPLGEGWFHWVALKNWKPATASHALIKYVGSSACKVSKIIVRISSIRFSWYLWTPVSMVVPLSYGPVIISLVEPCIIAVWIDPLHHHTVWHVFRPVIHALSRTFLRNCMPYKNAEQARPPSRLDTALRHSSCKCPLQHHACCVMHARNPSGQCNASIVYHLEVVALICQGIISRIARPDELARMHFPTIRQQLYQNCSLLQPEGVCQPCRHATKMSALQDCHGRWLVVNKIIFQQCLQTGGLASYKE